MVKKNALVIVSTPYHIIVMSHILAMKQFKDFSIDIGYVNNILVDQIHIFDRLDNIKDIVNLNFFSDCEDKKEPSFRIFRWIYLMKNIFMGQYWMNTKFKYKEKIYDSLFIPCAALSFQSIKKYERKKNPNIFVEVYEDGIGTYDDIHIKANWKRILVDKLFLGGDLFATANRLWVFRPELIFNIKYGIEILKIEVNEESKNNLIEYYKKDYSEILSLYKNKKIIFFDQCMMINNQLLHEKEINIVKNICSIVGEENILFKIHPRAKVVPEIKGVTIIRDRIPFEIVMNYMDINKCILISICSTACISPKLMDDKEPYIIFLENYFSDYFRECNLAKKICELYNCREKVCIPKRLDDFQKFFRSYLLENSFDAFQKGISE